MKLNLDSLNPSQKEAVSCPPGPVLVIAGAGSGKTRVLTYRMAYLHERYGVDLRQILAVTFTNKAAAEMRARVFTLLGLEDPSLESQFDLWISTFHSACVRILRSNIHLLGYQRSFTIYDDSDQLSVIKACMKELKISEETLAPKAIQAKINRLKNDGTELCDYKPRFWNELEDTCSLIFKRYTEALKLSGAVDFGDLILLTVKILKEHPSVRSALQNRFTHLMVDEYQDTNQVQYLFLKLLCGNTEQPSSIFAVGDEDQAIYRWRGANIGNILNFEKDFPKAQLFKLEQNYRSTKTIIEAASSVIAYNEGRRAKTLWTDNHPGEKIKAFELANEYEEAKKIIDIISDALLNDFSLNEMAIFYRTNAQSRLIEDALRQKSIPYQVYGGLKFYDRMEVKDALAYLRLIVNPGDDVSFRRIVNVPARGIGKVSLDRLSHKATEMGLSLYHTLSSLLEDEDKSVLGRAEKSFFAFHGIIESLKQQLALLTLSDFLSQVMESCGYYTMLKNDLSVEARSREENLTELKKSLLEFELRQSVNPGQAPAKLEDYLEQIALVSDIDKLDQSAACLKLMTIHMAKGLEFDVVGIVGLEEELFPYIRPGEPQEQEALEEERRLFYVGMTRARKRLSLFYAQSRNIFGHPSFRTVSRFLSEIPKDYLDFQKSHFFDRTKNFLERMALPRRSSQENQDQESSEVTYNYGDESCDVPFDDSPFQPGTEVTHPLFGTGTLSRLIGKDKAIIYFPDTGYKKISLTTGPLKLS